jgi:hypothetical protein
MKGNRIHIHKGFLSHMFSTNFTGGGGGGMNGEKKNLIIYINVNKKEKTKSMPKK